MRNLPCVGVASGAGLSGAIDSKTAEANAAMEPSDVTTAPQPPHSTSSYFATTYYHLTDDECTSFLSTNSQHCLFKSIILLFCHRKQIFQLFLCIVLLFGITSRVD